MRTSNFLDERSAAPGVGPVTVGPGVQNRGVGRVLMEDVVRLAADRGTPGVRLVQAVHHLRSLSLYAKLGFQVRDLLACMQGRPPWAAIGRWGGRRRRGGTARVVEHGGRISGYTTNMAFFGHAAGESNENLKALIGAADPFGGPGILVPTTNGKLFRWCLDHGLHMVQPMSLMSLASTTLRRARTCRASSTKLVADAP